MKKRNYKVLYVDGRDLRCKIAHIEANTKDEAAANLREKYPYGDFDHQIIEIKEMQT